MVYTRSMLKCYLAVAMSVLVAHASSGQVYETDYVVEVLAVFDRPMLDKWLSQDGVDSLDGVKAEITSLFFEVNQLYQSFHAYGINIEIRLQDIAFYEETILSEDLLTDADGVAVDIYDALYGLVDWLGAKGIKNYDHVMYLAHIDLINALGIAAVGEICGEFGVSILEAAFNFNLVVAMAHEIGHSLNLGHDDTYGEWECPAEQYVMYPTVSYTRTRWFFSSCSGDALYEKLNSFGDGSCLTDTTAEKIISRRMGEFLTADQFCRRHLGEEVYYKYDEGDDLCDLLNCWDGFFSIYYSNAPEGLSCGSGRKCYMGYCI